MNGSIARDARAAVGREARTAPDTAALLAALPVPLLALDAEDRIRFANPEAEQFFGLSAPQLAHLRLGDIVAADSPIFLLLETVRRENVTVSEHELSLGGPRLPERRVGAHCAPLPEQAGAVVLVVQDTSAARALDRRLSFRGAARSVAGMAAILAHEVRNPLSGIRGAAQLLESSVGGADRELAALIRDEADRIRALVDRMEAFGECPPARAGVNIHRVLEHVRKLAASGFAADARFVELYDPSLPPVWGNRDQLVQVMLNLVKNAAEAITEQGEGEITLMTAYQHGVRVAVPGSRRRVELPLLVTIRDTGPGIAEDMRGHLFEPFVTSKPGGRGLGLALVAKIIGDHGGLIEVDSRPGRTDFLISLPVLTDAEAV